LRPVMRCEAKLGQPANGQSTGPPGKQNLMASFWGCRVRVTAVAASLAAVLVSATPPLAAKDISINLGQGAAAGGLNKHIFS
jgi:hypothetical protein